MKLLRWVLMVAIAWPVGLTLSGGWSATVEYDGAARASGSGAMNPEQNEAGTSWRSTNSMTIWDTYTDGNNVYGITKWQEVNNWCLDVNADTTKYISGSAVACGTWGQQMNTYMTPETCQGCSATDPRRWLTTGFGSAALRSYGLKVEAHVCVQLGWPVSDRCSDPFQEWHQPVPAGDDIHP